MTFNARFSENKTDFSTDFEENKNSFKALFNEIQVVTDLPKYDGEYSVTPRVVEQTMYTKGKLMIDDVVIKEVPVYRVGNTSGGTTVYIAREV